MLLCRLVGGAAVDEDAAGAEASCEPTDLPVAEACWKHSAAAGAEAILVQPTTKYSVLASKPRITAEPCLSSKATEGPCETTNLGPNAMGEDEELDVVCMAAVLICAQPFRFAPPCVPNVRHFEVE